MPKKTKRTAKRPAKRSAKRARTTRSRRAPKFDPIPPGMHTVTPYLVVDGAERALEFYREAFNAQILDQSPAPGGKLMHAVMKVGDSMVMLSDEFPGSETRAPTNVGASTVMLHLYSRDVDRLWSQALAAGAKIAMPLEDRFWGERYGQLEDPFGHRWTLSMRVRMTQEEMAAKRAEAMAMFAEGEHPGYEETSEGTAPPPSG